MESGELSAQLNNLALVSWVLLIPVALLLMVVLFKLVMILNLAYEFMTRATYDLDPILKDVRQITGRAELLSEKAVAGVETLEKGIEKASHGVDRLKGVSEGFLGGFGGAMGTVMRALWDNLWRKKKKRYRYRLVDDE